MVLGCLLCKDSVWKKEKEKILRFSQNDRKIIRMTEEMLNMTEKILRMTKEGKGEMFRFTQHDGKMQEMTKRGDSSVVSLPQNDKESAQDDKESAQND